MMNSNEYKESLADTLFWDIDKDNVDVDMCSMQIVQRVLEYGDINDWQQTLNYYVLQRIVELCKQMRTLDPVCFSYICAISQTPKEDYRCYTTKLSMPTL